MNDPPLKLQVGLARIYSYLKKALKRKKRINKQGVLYT